MRTSLKQCLWIMVLGATLIPAGTTRLLSSQSSQAQPDDRQLDNPTNKYFKQGMRDARDDNQHRRDHFKKRKFKNDKDRQAYEAGYQAGHQGNLQEQ